MRVQRSLLFTPCCHIKPPGFCAFGPSPQFGGERCIGIDGCKESARENVTERKRKRDARVFKRFEERRAMTSQHRSLLCAPFRSLALFLATAALFRSLTDQGRSERGEGTEERGQCDERGGVGREKERKIRGRQRAEAIELCVGGCEGTEWRMDPLIAFPHDLRE